MKTAARNRLITVVLVLAAIAVVLLLLGKRNRVEPDEHEGQVYINDGFHMVWITPLEGVAVNPLTAEDFRQVNGMPEYTGTEFKILRGIDVSEHQKEIDWAQAAQSGIDFAMLRACRRGYTEGGLFTDPYFESNIQGALANGLEVGVYIFSQAITVSEAMEEADYILGVIAGYDISLPVVFDWEPIEDEGGARTDGLDSAILNDCAVAFCEKVKMAGYTPALYFNRQQGYYKYDLSRMTDYTLWLSAPGEFPDFYYAVDLWQYSFDANISGIAEPVDINLLFVPAEEPEQNEKNG